jgi:hypothetical protein
MRCLILYEIPAHDPKSLVTPDLARRRIHLRRLHPNARRPTSRSLGSNHRRRHTRSIHHPSFEEGDQGFDGETYDDGYREIKGDLEDGQGDGESSDGDVRECTIEIYGTCFFLRFVTPACDKKINRLIQPSLLLFKSPTSLKPLSQIVP